MSQTLLEKAYAAEVREQGVEGTNEEIELALAWLQGRVQGRAVAIALGVPKGSDSNALRKVAHFLRAAYSKGRIQIV